MGSNPRSGDNKSFEISEYDLCYALPGMSRELQHICYVLVPMYHCPPRQVAKDVTVFILPCNVSKRQLQNIYHHHSFDDCF